MKTFNYIIIILVIALSISCKTNKDAVSDNSNNNPPKSSYQTVSLPQIDGQEKKLSQEEINEITEFARKMAETYCNIKKLKVAYELDNDKGTERRLLDQQKQFEEMRSTSVKKYSGSLTKPEFDKVYNQYKKDCE